MEAEDTAAESIGSGMESSDSDPSSATLNPVKPRDADCALNPSPTPSFILRARETPGTISTKGVDSALPEPRGRERGSSSLRPLRRATTEARVGASEQEQAVAGPMGGDPLSPGKGKPAWKPTLLCPKNTWA